MKVPEPRKLPSGNWFIQLRLDGSSVPVTARSKKECIQQAQLIKAEYKAGLRSTVKVETTLGALIDEYIKRYEPVLSPATIMGYQTIRDYRFQTEMAQRFCDIKDWQGMINRELETKSEHTVRNAWGLVTATLNDAGLPVPSVKLPRIPVNEMNYLEPEEIPLFLTAIEGDPAEIEILLEMHSLRRSEMMTVIQNDRIDLKHNTITVSGAIVPGKDHKLVEKKTNKSRGSTRTVPIMIPRLAALVKEYRDAGEAIPVHGNTMILKHVHDACRRAGVTDVTNHGLRHTFAVLGYSVGISERALMELGGWDDPDTMHRIYIRVAQRDRERAKNKIAEFFTPPPSDPEQLRVQLEEDLAALCVKYATLPNLKGILMENVRSLPEQNANENANESERTA